MSDATSNEPSSTPEGEEKVQARRLFLESTGKWSGAAIVAAVAGTWMAGAPDAAAAWINRRGPGRGGWINRGGGGRWVNRGGGGSWVNRRGPGGSWVNRR